MAIINRAAARMTGAALLGGALLASPLAASAASHPESITHKTQGWTLTLKLLPAESFTHTVNASSEGEMNVLGGPGQPLAESKANHHLVVFLRHDGQPVEHATVQMRYQPVKRRHVSWKKVPVVRMDVAGKGAQTTHFGNNVLLKPGKYRVEVRVDHKVKSHFMVDVD